MNFKLRSRNLTPDLPTLICLGLIAIGCGGSGGGISQTATVTAGLIHEWKFNGDATDSVGALNASVVGAATHINTNSGQAIVLDGQTMGINVQPVPDMQFQASFTISAWANLYALPSGGKLWSSLIFDGDDRAGFDAYFISVDPQANLEFGICSQASNNNGVSTGGTMPLNQWVFITATYDKAAGTMRLYQNGQLVSQLLNNKTLTPVCALDPSANPGIGIGVNNDFPHSSSNYGWDGAISDVRIYNRALSASQISALYNQGN